MFNIANISHSTIRRMAHENKYAVCVSCAEEYHKNELDNEGVCGDCRQNRIDNALEEMENEREQAQALTPRSPGWENTMEAFLCRD